MNRKKRNYTSANAMQPIKEKIPLIYGANEFGSYERATEKRRKKKAAFDKWLKNRTAKRADQ